MILQTCYVSSGQDSNISSGQGLTLVIDMSELKYVLKYGINIYRSCP